MVQNNKDTVLVIEDERGLLKAVELKLSKEDYSVVTAQGVEDGLEAVKNNKIDVIWLDHYLMGNRTGLDFVAQIKNDTKFKNIPIFVVTNTASDAEKQSYMKFGIVDYIVKSNHRLDDIIAEIRKYLSGDRSKG